MIAINSGKIPSRIPPGVLKKRRSIIKKGFILLVVVIIVRRFKRIKLLVFSLIT